MKTLPQTKRKNGHDYVQVFRGPKAAIYRQCFRGMLVGYEVILIRVQKGRSYKGNWLETRERFPHDEAFGKWAWAFSSMERALEKYIVLTNG